MLSLIPAIMFMFILMFKLYAFNDGCISHTNSMVKFSCEPIRCQSCKWCKRRHQRMIFTIIWIYELTSGFKTSAKIQQKPIAVYKKLIVKLQILFPMLFGMTNQNHYTVEKFWGLQIHFSTAKHRKGYDPSHPVHAALLAKCSRSQLRVILYRSAPTIWQYTYMYMYTYGSVSAGREKWPFNVLFFFKSRASVWPNLMR